MKQFKHWLSRGTVLMFGLLLAANVFLPQAFAADACMCFCGDRDLGAFEAGSYGSANECAQTCSDADAVYVGCFTNESMYPENNNLCWTQDECAKYPINIAGTTHQGDWGGQNAYCSKQSISNAEMGYCYGPMLPVTLNVPIMGVMEISALGDYVNLLYTYAIPLAGIFGALMFTIAGFQYMTAGGDKGAVSKAKARMTNTVSGIVFLMAVYAIAYLIDPRLTRFNELRPPMVKEAVIVDDATTCEAMFGYGFCIDGKCPSGGVKPSKECGKKGEITGDNEVDLNIANPPEVGDECMYSGCDDKSKSCVIKGDRSGGVCAACDDVSALRERTPGQSIGLTPSEFTCSQIASRAQAREGNEDIIYTCFFDDDLAGLSEADALGADECVQLYSSSNGYIDCLKISNYARKEEDGCSVYDSNIDAKSYGWDGGILAWMFSEGNADQVEDIKNVYGAFCEADLCEVADRGTVQQGSCKFVDSNLIDEGLDTVLNIFNVFENYACTGAQTLADAE